MNPLGGVSSETMGWSCRNNHFNNRARTTTVCETCGAIRDPTDLYGDAPRVNQIARMTNASAGEAESGQRRFRVSRDDKRRGIICFRCAELVPTPLENTAPGSRTEQPGTRLEVFLTMAEHRQHMRLVHPGQPPWPGKVLRQFRRDSEKRARAREEARDQAPPY